MLEPTRGQAGVTGPSAAERIPLEGVLGALLSSETYGVGACDREGRVVLWNRGCERLYGWERSEVLGRVLPVIPDEQADTFRRMVDEVIAGTSIDDFTMENVTRDGERVDVLISLRPVRTAIDGEPLVLAITVARDHHDEVDREALARRIELLEYQLAETQLPPHFLFNALHAVGSAMRGGDTDRALAMLADLGDVLRHSLRHSPEDLVPLHDELAVLRRYVELERARFQGELRIRIDVTPDVEGALVPALLLQPLVENAIKHGLAPRDGSGELTVRARSADGRLLVTVADDGVGLGTDDGEPPAERIGLRGTRLRLRHLYGEDQRLEIGRREGGGTLARVELPLSDTAGSG